jgi:hypothetical protein
MSNRIPKLISVFDNSIFHLLAFNEAEITGLANPSRSIERHTDLSAA